MNTNKINKNKAVELISNTKGKIFTVTFEKKDGSTRTINCNYKRPKNVNPLGYMTVYDMQEKAYRNVNSQTIKMITFKGTTYKVK